MVRTDALGLLRDNRQTARAEDFPGGANFWEGSGLIFGQNKTRQQTNLAGMAMDTLRSVPSATTSPKPWKDGMDRPLHPPLGLPAGTTPACRYHDTTDAGRRQNCWAFLLTCLQATPALLHPPQQPLPRHLRTTAPFQHTHLCKRLPAALAAAPRAPPRTAPQLYADLTARAEGRDGQRRRHTAGRASPFLGLTCRRMRVRAKRTKTWAPALNILNGTRW